jgi:3-dehydroquinate dehydratase
LLTLNKLENIFKQRALAKKYALHYAVQYTKMKVEEISISNITKAEVLRELSVGGSHYEEVLKANMKLKLIRFYMNIYLLEL